MDTELRRRMREDANPDVQPKPTPPAGEAVKAGRVLNGNLADPDLRRDLLRGLQALQNSSEPSNHITVGTLDIEFIRQMR